jgi:[ribosomal protein S5]-alanine N-acetyltransferase
MVWTPHASETATEAYIESCMRAWAAGNPMPYIIEELSTHRAIGMIDARIAATSVDIGYVLGKQYWGKSLMSEAISALTTEK